MRLKSNTLLAEKSQFGDQRLSNRFSKICHQFSSNLNGTIPESSIKRSSIKATYNFFHNDKVSVDKMIAGHLEVHQKDRDQVQKQVLLVAQDSSDLVYSGKRSSADFGPLLCKNNRGCKLHSSLMISPSGVPIGLFKQSSIIRSDATFGKSHHRTREPIEDKESYRWLEHFEALQDYFHSYPNIEVFNVCDREGDFYELLAAGKVDHVHLLIRSQYSQTLKDDPEHKIHSKVASDPVRATFKFDIANSENRKTRKATVTLKFCPVHFELTYPNPFQRELPAVNYWAIQVEETNPPKGIKPVKWILLSSKKVKSIAMAKTIVRYYELRWIIERFHYILKVGAKVTQLQLSTTERVLNAVAAYSISAVNIMRINYLARVHPDWDIDQIGVTELEYKALYSYASSNIDKKLKFDPVHPPTIREFVITIARLGGFTDFSNQPHPGLKVFWRGWNTFQTIVKSYRAFFSNE
ncbi:MAG: IS4 family transposase [Bacteroidota bacterium]